MGSTFPPSSRWGVGGEAPTSQGRPGAFCKLPCRVSIREGQTGSSRTFHSWCRAGTVGDFGGSAHQKNRLGGQGQGGGGQLPFGSLLVVAVVQGCGFSFFLGSEHPVLPGSPVLLWAGPVGAGVRTLGPQICLERAEGTAPRAGGSAARAAREPVVAWRGECRGWAEADARRSRRGDRTDPLLGTRLPAGRWSGPQGWEPLFPTLNLVRLGGALLLPLPGVQPARKRRGAGRETGLRGMRAGAGRSRGSR